MSASIVVVMWALKVTTMTRMAGSAQGTINDLTMLALRVLDGKNDDTDEEDDGDDKAPPPLGQVKCKLPRR